MLQKHKYILFISINCILLFSNCKKKEKSPVNSVIKKTEKATKKKPQKLQEKELDTINKDNAVSFLEAYGKLNPETIVLIETRLGNLKIKLYPETPLHRASFVFLTKTGYFNTTAFHRIVPNFIVQGGNSDFPITRKLRMKYNYRIPAEMKPNRTHKYGALAAARQWENNPNKISSPFEFYMIQDKRGSHHLDGEHTIFGEIMEGFDTMEKIAKLETDKKEWPLKEVFIKASVIR